MPYAFRPYLDSSVTWNQKSLLQWLQLKSRLNLLFVRIRYSWLVGKPNRQRNLFTYSRFQNFLQIVKIIAFCDSVAVFVRIGLAWKRDFPFIKLEGKMPLFDLKSALNQLKMFQNTCNIHQSSISVSTFRKYEQQFITVKNLAAATHFPLKIPWNSLFRRKIPF